MLDVLLKSFEDPDEVREFEKGRFEVVHIGDRTFGRASYEPGWKWSEHVGAATGETSCRTDHIGLVVSGHIAVAMDGGETYELGPGDFFSIGPGHDSWVIGNDPYVSLHFMGAEEYASGK